MEQETVDITKKTPAKAPAHAARAPRAAATHSAAHAHAASHASASHTAAHAPREHKAIARYTEAVGRRKTAIARVRMTAGTGKMTVNDKDVKAYFSLPRLVNSAMAPLKELQLVDFDVTVHVSGGGVNAQAEAIRHGLSRAIIEKDAQWKPRLRAMGYVTRDSRMVERKKYGLRKARRAPQWAKR